MCNLFPPSVRGKTSNLLPIGPKLLPKLDKLPNNIPTQHNTPLKPLLPADITTRQESELPINDDKFWMNDTDGQEKDALDLQIDSSQFFRARQAETSAPLGRRVDSAFARLRMGEFLPDAGGGEADSHACPGGRSSFKIPSGEFAQAVADAVQGV